jgi:hypothetical protein
MTSETLFEALLAKLKNASNYNANDAMPPAAVLWTDKESLWLPLLPRLRGALPLLTLGPYAPDTRTGPAIWIRCMVARTLPEANWPPDTIPIIYLPGVSRQELRAVEDCRRDLKPLAELQYRGAMWTQKNARDWTINAFLQTADGGLQIEVTGDEDTRAALRLALPKLADQPVAALRAEAPLTAAKLHALLNPEPVLNLLQWLNDPAGQRVAQSDAEWQIFCAICKQRFAFDPIAQGELSGAALLGRREGAWQGVWNRFAEAPLRYPALPDLLRRARPTDTTDLFYQPSSWPQENESGEETLRDRLAALKDAQPADARKQVRELENAHGERRQWVWADLGRAPLACLLPTLLTLADATEQTLSGTTPQEIANAYTAGAWKADAAALTALAVSATPETVTAVKYVVNALYQPWLRAGAEAFQKAIANHPLPAPAAPGKPDSPKQGCCWLFADGLRYDVAQGLADTLEAGNLAVKRTWQWAAFPSVTPTAKPAVSPVASLLGPGKDFDATVISDGAKVDVGNLRRELKAAGYAILMKDEVGTPSSGAAWTEAGALDQTGHQFGWKLALRVPEEIKQLAERVRALLDAGWTEVRIVTDHGWLLLPFGLPKADLPLHLTEARKGRCARLIPAAQTDQQTIPWRWDASVQIAVPPGISCYVANEEYEHGGLSVQECVTPILTVKAAAVPGPAASIASIKWAGLRCRIQVAGVSESLTADLRTKPADATTSLANQTRTVDANGQASLAVKDDSHEGEAAVVVLLGSNGQIIAQQATVVGET